VKKSVPVWPTAAEKIAIHDMLLAQFGGLAGLKSRSGLESALGRGKNLVEYGSPDLFDIAAFCAGGIVRNHPFADGNKRVALALAGVFLELNDWRLEAPEASAVLMTLGLAAKELDEAAYADWLRTNSRALKKPRPRSR
jgi:death-on-curing protein